MKRIALATLLFVSPLVAADKPVIPDVPWPASGHFLCISVKGLDRPTCGGAWADNPVDPLFFREVARNFVAFMGMQAINTLPLLNERERALGRKLLEIYPAIAFPELGDAVTKDTPAVAYCSSSSGQDVTNPFQIQGVKAPGRGGCSDFLTVYLRPAGK